MSDNSFEKKVRHELQGFGVTPSEKVWAQLEAGLKERKRRRGGFIWFFLGTLLLGGGVWLAVKQSSHPAENIFAEANDQKVLKNTPALKASAEDEKTTTAEPKLQPGQKEILPLNSSTAENAENTSSRNTAYTALKRNSAEVIIADTESKNENAFTPSAALPEKNTKIAGNNEKGNGNVDVTKRVPTENNPIPDPSVPQLPVVSEQSEAVTDSTTVAVNTKNSGRQEPVSSQTAQSKKRKLEKPEKWDVNLTGSVGLSEVTSGFLEAGTKSSDMFNTGNFGPTMPINYTHSQEKSFGFSGGAEVRRWLTKSVALSAGLQYQFQRTNSLVGTMSNSNLVVYNGAQDLTVNRFYLPGALTEYRNRYHLIDLPLQVQLAWGQKKLPFIAGMGVQPGILLGSNAMIKDRSGILFTDKENFSRFQFGLNAGLSVRLMKSSKMPLEVGPQLQYRLTNIFKEETGYKGHLFYFGLQAKWRLLSF